jgi:peroxiredoxin
LFFPFQGIELFFIGSFSNSFFPGPACSSSHIPGYINHPKLKDAGNVFVVSVNDSFVMKAWAASLDPTGKSGVRVCTTKQT